MLVKSIVIYPIKGCRGVEIDSCAVHERGFENDRRYMLVDKHNMFVSQRSHPELSQIITSLTSKQIDISYDDERFSFDLDEITNEVINITLFEHTISGTIVSQAANSYFSNILGEDIRFVKMTQTNTRHKKLIKGPEATEVSFADGYPYLIVGTDSLRQLNARLDSPVLMDRFRPNIIIETSTAHIEDSWESIKVGDVDMLVIKPCARCSVITIDQQTAEKSKGTIKALSSYRKVDNKIYFGVNAITLSRGHINIGDSVVTL